MKESRKGLGSSKKTSKVLVLEDKISIVFFIRLTGLLQTEWTGRALEEVIYY